MRKIRVDEAVGTMLGHDLTKIVPGEFKGAAYKKGQVVTEEDVEALKKMGKHHIWVIDLADDEIHEDEAAMRIARALAGEEVHFTGPSEGKMSLHAREKGLLKVDEILLEKLNNHDDVVISTMRNNTVVDAETIVAATRILPLKTGVEVVKEIEGICSEQGLVVQLKKLQPLKVGVLITGTEVYQGLIEDKFSKVLVNKLEELGGIILKVVFAPDEEDRIGEEINDLIKAGAQLVLAAGGMSVDADDMTPKGIEGASTEVITYGAPVLPGAMLMLAYQYETPILGVPACAMYHKITALDLVLPRIFAGEKPTKREIRALGHGGLCLHCHVCRYPVCPLAR